MKTILEQNSEVVRQAGQALVKIGACMSSDRDDRSPAYPVGKSALFYGTGLNPPFFGAKGSTDEFLWVVYRKQRCCTCCQ